MESPFSGKEKMPQIDTLGQQVKPPMPEMGYILLSHLVKEIPHHHPKHHRLLSTLLAILHNQMVRPYH